MDPLTRKIDPSHSKILVVWFRECFTSQKHFPTDLIGLCTKYSSYIYLTSFSNEYKTNKMELSNNNLTMKSLDEQQSILCVDSIPNNDISIISFKINNLTDNGYNYIGILSLEKHLTNNCSNKWINHRYFSNVFRYLCCIKSYANEFITFSDYSRRDIKHKQFVKNDIIKIECNFKDVISKKITFYVNNKKLKDEIKDYSFEIPKEFNSDKFYPYVGCYGQNSSISIILE